MRPFKRSRVIDTTYRGCPECTYPLRKSIGVEGNITYVISKCTNNRCGYTRKRKIAVNNEAA